MTASTVRYTSFPKTSPPPQFTDELVEVFRANEARIGTEFAEDGLKSDEVLHVLRDDLVGLGFEVEAGKRSDQKILRPVFYGENGVPTLQYQIDAYNAGWACGLEIEAGRAWMGNAVYRDLITACVMVQVEHLVLAVPNSYKYAVKSVSRDYKNAVTLAEALYGHSRLRLPYDLIIVGY